MHENVTHKMTTIAIECIKQHKINPFTVDISSMLNIATGQAITATIKKVLETVEQIDKTELQKRLKNIKKVKVHTFEELLSKPQ